MSIQEGQIHWADLNPIKGREQKGIRPCVVVSGESLNMHSDICFICPITTTIKNFEGNLILIPNKENGLKQKSEILAQQIRTIDKTRLKSKIGKLTQPELESVRRGIILYLYN